MALKELLLKRSGYQCEYRSGETRCTQRTGLEIHHDIVPYGKGGGHSEANLLVFCKSHNLFCAEREYGRAFLERKISENS